MDEREAMARTMGSLLALTESLLNGEKYEGEDGEKAKELVAKVKSLLARSNARHATTDLARCIRIKIAKIPAHNPSVISLYQETLGSVLSDAMLWKIAKVAAEEATAVLNGEEP